MMTTKHANYIINVTAISCSYKYLQYIYDFFKILMLIT